MRREIEPGETVTEAIVYAVAEATGREPTSMQPFAESIDADAVEAHFARAAGDGDPTLSVTYEGCRVTVTRDAVDVELLVDV